MKKLAASLFTNTQIRKDIYDIAKVIVGVVAAKYGLKFA